MSFRAIIFDMDGTLLDTERFYKAAFERAAGVLGFHTPPWLQDQIVGLASPDRAQVLQSAWGKEFPVTAFLDRYRVERMRALPDRIPVVANAFVVVRTARSRGLATAIATSASRRTAMSHLRRAGMAGLFSEVVSRDDVSRGKPAPDVYLEAAHRLGLRPSECLAVEDSLPGVRAAVSAGMTCIRVADTSCALADATLLTLSELPDWMRREKRRRGGAPSRTEITGAAS